MPLGAAGDRGGAGVAREHHFGPDDVESVAIESFREAIDLGSHCLNPATTDEAQYSLTFPVASALVTGRVDAEAVNGAGDDDPRTARLLGAMTLVEDAEFSSRFPRERWARVRIELRDGRTVVSEPAQARGNPENPLSDDELAGKYHALADPVLGAARQRGSRR